MSKELAISSNRHETRVAILEDDQVFEVYHQRENEYSLAGSIHKGRVTRVLPGMQSAFVDIGLDRDAFLYVSDFFEDNEEYDKIVSSVEEQVLKMGRVPVAAVSPAPATVSEKPRPCRMRSSRSRQPGTAPSNQPNRPCRPRSWEKPARRGRNSAARIATAVVDAVPGAAADSAVDADCPIPSSTRRAITPSTPSMPITPPNRPNRPKP